MFDELGTPKIVAENEVNISHISQKLTIFAILTRVGRHCRRFLGPQRTDLAEILRGVRARVWQQMIGISLMCVDVRGSSG